jgi:DNA polymerase elongation subunit (family B)
MKQMFIYNWTLDSDEIEQTSIRIYGIDSIEGRTKNICLRVDNFTPYIYIELPICKDINIVKNIVRNKLNDKKLVVNTATLYRHHLYNNKNVENNKLAFLFCQCKSKMYITAIKKIMENGISIPGLGITKLNVHEDQASPILQLVSKQDIPMAGWIKFKGDLICKEDQITSCDEEYSVDWKKIHKCSDLICLNPKYLAFDIEVNSTFMNQMPMDNPGDSVFQISCIIKDPVTLDEKKILLSIEASDMDLSSSDLLEDIEVRVYEKEIDILDAFFEIIEVEKPNVITGFNIFGFDIEYIMKRAHRLKVMDKFRSVGFNKYKLAPIEIIKWSSSAYKNQEFKFINWEGILLIDLLPLVRRDYKLDTYSLKNVASTFLKNDNKDPVTAKDIFLAYQTRTKLDIVGKYCVQDSNICIQLVKHFNSWIALSEMAKVCNVSMFTLYTQGQQIKTYSQVYKYCTSLPNDEQIVVTTNGYQTKTNERYTGAYVFEPIPAYYHNVVPFDFMSLYPSVIIAMNICYSTIANDNVPSNDCNVFEWEDHVGCEHDPIVIETQELTRRINVLETEIKALMTKRNSIKSTADKKRIQNSINQLRELQKPLRNRRSDLSKSKVSDREDDEGNIVSGVICAKRSYRFLKASVKKGVIPSIIQNLLDSRKRVREAMKHVSPEQKVVLDKEQLAYKVSANSMYGAMGVRRGYLPFMPGAMCITYFGRKSIEKTTRLITDKWNGTVIYADTDSNYVIFPHIHSIQETWDYAKHVAEQVSKEFPPPMKLEFEATVYARFLILSKKRYMYQETDKDGNLNHKIGKKGVILARRDNSGVLKHIYESVTSMIFNKDSSKDIEEFIIEYINQIFRNTIPHHQYVITKSIGSTSQEILGKHFGDYKMRQILPEDPDEQARILNEAAQRLHKPVMTKHDYYISQCPAPVILAQRMRDRGILVNPGSRIPYVVIQRHRKNTTLGHRIEDYEYFCKHSSILKIDPEYYIDSFINPLDQVLKVGINNDHFMSDQYRIRMQHQKVIKDIKELGYTKLKIMNCSR